MDRTIEGDRVRDSERTRLSIPRGSLSIQQTHGRWATTQYSEVPRASHPGRARVDDSGAVALARGPATGLSRRTFRRTLGFCRSRTMHTPVDLPHEYHPG